MLTIKTLEDYNNIVDSIKDCMDFYDGGFFKDNKYTLYLANGKKIKYSINENNIPHLLGINIDNFISMNLLRNDSYYNILNKFIDESYLIYKKICSGGGILVTTIFSLIILNIN